MGVIMTPEQFLLGSAWTTTWRPAEPDEVRQPAGTRFVKQQFSKRSKFYSNDDLGLDKYLELDK